MLDRLGAGDINLPETPTMRCALEVVARSCSTSYRDVLDADRLRSILASGDATSWVAYISTLLQETPSGIVLCAVWQAANDAPHRRAHQKWVQEFKSND